MKLSEEPYELDSAEVARLTERTAQFRKQTGTRKAVCTVLVTAAGLRRNKHSGLVQNVVTLDDLFAD